jgi:acyl-coenzyme A synthetase/AMP-(fatty) acid ligase
MAASIGWMGEGRAEGNNFKARFSHEDLPTYPSSPPDYQNGINDPAHILFTSGSTGVPNTTLSKSLKSWVVEINDTKSHQFENSFIS